MAVTTDTSVTELLATYKDSSDTAITDTFGYLDLGGSNLTTDSNTDREVRNYIVTFNNRIVSAMGNQYTNSKVRSTIVLNGLP